jgi:hypothetical protein
MPITFVHVHAVIISSARIENLVHAWTRLARCFCARAHMRNARDFARRVISVCTRVAARAYAPATRPLRLASSRLRLKLISVYALKISHSGGWNWNRQGRVACCIQWNPRPQSVQISVTDTIANRLSTGFTLQGMIRLRSSTYCIVSGWNRCDHRVATTLSGEL